jgi:hypothetical protein
MKHRTKISQNAHSRHWAAPKKLWLGLASVAAIAVVFAPLASGRASASSCLPFYQSAYANGTQTSCAPSSGLQGKPKAKIYFTSQATSSKVNAGQTFKAVLHEDSASSKINAVKAQLYYNASKLKLEKSSASASAFQVKAQDKAKGGFITITRGSYQPLSGNQKVETFVFKALRPGKTTLRVTRDSTLVSSESNQSIAVAAKSTTLRVAGGSSKTASHSRANGHRGPRGTHFFHPEQNPSKSSRLSITPDGANQPVHLQSGSSVKLTAPALVQIAPGTSGHIQKVEYYLNKDRVATISAAPFQYRLDVKHMRNGTYHLKTKTFRDNGKMQARTASLVVKNPWSATQAGLQARHYIWLLVIIAIVVVELITTAIVRNRRTVPVTKGASNEFSDSDNANQTENSDDMPHFTERKKDYSAGHVFKPKRRNKDDR